MPQLRERTPCSSELLTSLLLAIGVAFNAASGAPPVVLTLPDTATGAEIQKALDNLPPGGEVVLSAGTYEITRPLVLRHNDETLRGSGPSTILHLANGAACPVVILGSPMTAPTHPVAHVRLSDLLIDGNRTAQKVEHWQWASDGSEINNNGVHIWHVTDAAVERVICRRCRSGGLVAVETRRLQVEDFQAYDNQFDGLACYQTEDSRFAGLRLHDNLAAGISLDLAFNHNCITNAVLSGNDVGLFIRDSRNNSFQGVTISGSRHDGVFMAQAVFPTAKGWRLTPNTQCIGNNFENLTVNDCGGKAFQVNDASCTNNTISGASFLRNISGGLVQPSTNPVSLREVAKR